MRRVLVAALAAGFVIEGLLIVKVIRDRSADADPVATPAAPATDSPAPAPTSTEPAGNQRLHVAANGHVVRSWRGSCSEAGRARLEISTTGGRSFSEIALPILEEGSTAPGVHTLLAGDMADRDNITIVGSDRGCSTAAYRTTDGGKSWEKLDEIDGWYLSASGSEVSVSGKASRPGCTILRVAPLNPQNAKVLCSDGRILGTNDEGIEWTVLGELEGAVDLAFTGLRDGFALTATDGCAAQIVTTSDAGGTWDDLACVVEESEGVAESIAVRGAFVVAQVAGEVYRSTDAGRTWEKA